jgi:hypothetical protein
LILNTAISFQITNTMLYVVNSLYAIYNLFNFVFLILLSNNGPFFLGPAAFDIATLVKNALMLLAYFAVAFALLFLSVNQGNWKVGGGAVQPCSFKYFVSPNCRTVLLADPPSTPIANIPAQQDWREPIQPPHDVFLPSTSVAQPRREPMRPAATVPEHVLNAQLTDEQIDLLGRLSSANVPPTDIVRLTERMRAGWAASGQGLASGEMHSVMSTGTAAPPSYHAIEH